MESLGNQFVVIDQTAQTNYAAGPEAEAFFQQIRPAFDAASFDQLLVLERSELAELRMRVFNRDGTEVEQCGNGLRCVAAYAQRQGLFKGSVIRIETLGRIAEATVLDNQRVRVAMGKAVFDPGQIPFLTDQQQAQYAIDGIDLSWVEQTMPAHRDEVAALLQAAGVVSMGNPHVVLDAGAVELMPHGLVANLGEQFQNLSVFPQGVNVGFMHIDDRSHIRLRVYERGVGETEACGSGACAAVAVGRLWGLLDNTVQVNLPGGILEVCDDAKKGLIATGPVVFHTEAT